MKNKSLTLLVEAMKKTYLLNILQKNLTIK